MNTGSGLLAGKWPAVIESYDPGSRTCRVSIPGVTEGADEHLVAEIQYPIGDKSRHHIMTEIEIFAGDLVWIEFIQGDPRYPLITGWRNPLVGNDKDFRRWHQKNIELIAEKLICHLSGGDSRAHSGAVYQVEAADDVRLKSGKRLKVHGDDVVQISSGKSVVIKSMTGSITLRSSTGTFVV